MAVSGFWVGVLKQGPGPLTGNPKHGRAGGPTNVFETSTQASITKKNKGRDIERWSKPQQGGRLFFGDVFQHQMPWLTADL